jgi:transposase
MIRNVDALRDDQWERLRDLVPGGRAGQRGPRCDNRRFVDALLWMARSGGRWRDLPERFGDYQAVKRRYYRWIERGALDRFLDALTAEADLEWPMIDSTIVRAHQHAAGARIAKGGRMPGAWADSAAGRAPKFTPRPMRSASPSTCCSGQASATTSQRRTL